MTICCVYIHRDTVTLNCQVILACQCCPMKYVTFIWKICPPFCHFLVLACNNIFLSNPYVLEIKVMPLRAQNSQTVAARVA